MLTKKSKVVSVSTPEISVSPEVTKPRARAKTSTSQITVPAEKPLKAAATVRHTRVSSRKPMKAAEPMSQSFGISDVASRAYHIWLERGCPEGTELENWARAEQELRALAVG